MVKTWKVEVKDFKWWFFVILFSIAIGVMFIALGALGVISIHDAIFQEEEYKSEFLVLDDVQYTDDGNILYRFGDMVIKDKVISNKFNVNELYEIIYIKYSHSWNYENDVWKYDEIKSNQKCQ